LPSNLLIFIFILHDLMVHEVHACMDPTVYTSLLHAPLLYRRSHVACCMHGPNHQPSILLLRYPCRSLAWPACVLPHRFSSPCISTSRWCQSK
jgi:hypothetical protein